MWISPRSFRHPYRNKTEIKREIPAGRIKRNGLLAIKPALRRSESVPAIHCRTYRHSVREVPLKAE